MKEDLIVGFLKFANKKEYANDILAGKLYANDVEYFRNLEVETGERGQGDKNELLYKIPYAKIELYDSTTKKLAFKSNKASAMVFHKSDDKIPLVCFVGIKESDLIFDEREQGITKYRFPFSENELKEMELKFGRYCVLITTDALFKRFNMLSTIHRIDFGEVKYVKSDDLAKATAHFEGDISRFYYKDKDLSYQREYRLCIITIS